MTRIETSAQSCADLQASPAASRSLSRSFETASPKIQPEHLERLAVVYVRQSSPHQIIENRESTARQYALADRATQLGWPRDRVLVIDEDQGRSGTTAEGRAGFQRLLVEVNLDHVGLILSLEMSRLARSSKDWHHLLEVSAIFRSLLGDSDGLYDPNDPNDRMLLGLKGTISEVELHTSRSRLNQGRLNKARRGKLFTLAPIGHVRLPSDELALDPDERVQSVVHLLFEKFEELRSASGTLRYFVRHGIQIGVRQVNGCVPGPVEWRVLGYSTLLEMVHNPIYAGAYCLGRRSSDLHRRKPSSRRKRRYLPMEEWDVLLKDTLPAYITWDQFIAKQATLKANHARISSLGSARNGKALLPGLLICGSCGARMVVSYKKDSIIRYSCLRQYVGYQRDYCQHLKGNPIEELVSEKVLSVLEPAAVELSLDAAEDIQRQRNRLHLNWQQRLERARYDASRARRQYDAVEPENRLVGRELEQRWETALRNQQTLEEEYHRFCRDQPSSLSAEERKRIRLLSSVVSKIWHAPETTPQDRKTIVRQLVERVIVRRNGDVADVTIHWAGGYVSEHQVWQPVGKFTQLRDFERFKKRVLELHAAGWSYPQICAQLKKEKFQSPLGLDLFRPENIRTFLHRYCSNELHPNWGSFREYVGKDEWLVGDLSRKLSIPQATLHFWLRRGWILGRQLRPNRGRWILWADADELERLRKLRACPINYNAKEHPYPQELTSPKPRPMP